MAMASLLTFIFTLSIVPYYLLFGTSALCHVDDETGLLGFKSAITSDPSGLLSTWKRGSDCCQWLGVFCRSSPDNRVSTLMVVRMYPFENLTGTLLPSLGKLQHMVGLYPTEYLTGTLSPSLAKLQHMVALYLSLGNVSGTFPRFLFDLPNLRTCYITKNKLSGPLPTDIGRLTHLNELILEGNRFTGLIPSSISQLTQIQQIDLGGNLLVGPIPNGIRKLTSLRALDLSRNNFSGKIPELFSSLTFLGSLLLSHNRFSGEVPASIASLAPKLNSLELNHNLLTGKIPDYLGNFKELLILDLSSNQFSGIVPKTFKNLTNILILNLSRNKLINPFPEMNVQELQSLDLSYNQFKLGKIPKLVFSSPISYSLKLAGCGIKMKFEDFKPSETGYEYIDLSDNKISGSPVRLLNQMNSLVEFAASRNQLKFNMSDLKLPTTLKDLDLSRNQIFGKVPVSILGLKTVNVSHNHLCGQIPVSKFPVSSFQGNDCLCGSPLPQCKS